MTLSQANRALELTSEINFEKALAKEIGEGLMYGTEANDYEDATTTGYGVFYHVENDVVEIWKNITTEDRGWERVAEQQNPVVFLGFITPSDAISTSGWAIQCRLQQKVAELSELLD